MLTLEEVENAMMCEINSLNEVENSFKHHLIFSDNGDFTKLNDSQKKKLSIERESSETRNLEYDKFYNRNYNKEQEQNEKEDIVFLKDQVSKLNTKVSMMETEMTELKFRMTNYERLYYDQITYSDIKHLNRL